MAQFEKQPEVVEAWRTRGNRNITTLEGQKIAQPGQWIVPTSVDGVYLILNDEDFREQYSATDDEAQEALDAPFRTAEEVAEEARAQAEQDTADAAAEEAKADAEKKAEEEGEEKGKKGKKKGLLAKAKDALTGGGGKDAEEKEYDDGFLDACKELVVEAKKLPQSDELVKGLAELETALELGASQEFISGKCDPVQVIVDKVKADGNEDK